MTILDLVEARELDRHVRAGDSPLNVFRHPYAHCVVRRTAGPAGAVARRRG